MDKFDSLEKTASWIVVGLIAIGIYMYFDKRRTDSHNKFMLERWCDRILRGMYLADDADLPVIIRQRNVQFALQYLESLGAKTVIDVSENCVVICHRGRQHQMSIVDV